MKKLIAVLLVMIMALCLAGCGPKGEENTLNTGDAPFTSADIPAETLPTVSDVFDDVTASDTEPISETDPISDALPATEDSAAGEPAVTTTPVATSNAPATTTTAGTTTQATTTTKGTTTTQAATTTNSPATTTTADPDDEWEEDDIVSEVIENLDEWFISMGFDTLPGVNANE